MEFHTRISKITKIIVQIMKILEFDANITKIITNLWIRVEHYENHENHLIPYDNFENHENIKIPVENH